MKLYATIGKIVTAIAAVAGIIYLVIKYMDNIKAWLAQVCPCCKTELEEDFVVEDAVTEEAPAAEAAPEAEAPAAEEPAPAEEAAETAPTAEEADFEA